MKVLISVDFSNASLNAAKWAIEFVGQFEQSEILLSHFIHMPGRASMFLSMDDLLLETAENDMKSLIEELKSIDSGNTSYSTLIFKGDPKINIPKLAKQRKVDLIVTGTSGLNALKNMTVGSTTEYIINHSEKPLITIPVDFKYRPIHSICMGVDNKMVESGDTIEFLRKLLVTTEADLHVVHINDDENKRMDTGLSVYLKGHNLEYYNLKPDPNQDIADQLSDFLNTKNMDLLCMIHKHKNWFQRLFRSSNTKKELYVIEHPLLVLRYIE